MKRALVGALAVAVAAAGLWLVVAGGADDASPPHVETAGAAPRPAGPQTGMKRSARVEGRAPGQRGRPPVDRASFDAAEDAGAGPDAPMFVETRPVMLGMNRRKEALVAFRAGDHETARALALDTLTHLPRDGQAHRIVAISSCVLGDRDSAQTHAEMLDRGRFEKIQTRCAKHGIALLHPYEPASDDADDAGDAGPAE